jgi:hypothetical protein
MNHTNDFLLIRPDGTMERRRCSGTDTERLEQLHAALDTTVLSMVHLGERHAGYLCDEGKLRNLPPNSVATALWRHLAELPDDFPDYIAGTFLVVGTHDANGEHTGYDFDPDDAVEKLAWQLCIAQRISARGHVTVVHYSKRSSNGNETTSGNADTN